MKKYRICTTISEKHWELLKKFSDKYDTQQKTLELALDRLEDNSKNNHPLTPEEELWMRHANVQASCLVQKDCLKWLMATADIEGLKEIVAACKPLEYAIEYYYNKPLKECSLREVIDGMLITARMSHWFDTADYREDGDHYIMKITHSLGLNNSKMLKITNESVFRTYGVKFESTISEKTLFIKIYKNGMA